MAFVQCSRTQRCLGNGLTNMRSLLEGRVTGNEYIKIANTPSTCSESALGPGRSVGSDTVLPLPVCSYEHV